MRASILNRNSPKNGLGSGPHGAAKIKLAGPLDRFSELKENVIMNTLVEFFLAYDFGRQYLGSGRILAIVAALGHVLVK